jgi:hypothetical protein
MKLQLRCYLLPQFHSKPSNQRLPDLLLQAIDLLIRQRSLQTPIIDAITQALPPGGGVDKLIDELHVLDQVARDVPDDLHDVVLVGGVGEGAAGAAGGGVVDPEGNVLVARGVFGEGHEARYGCGA